MIKTTKLLFVPNIQMIFMNKKFIHWLFVALPFLFCTGCEYELQETNYVEINKPQEFNYEIQLQAPLNEKGEYILKYGFLKFSSVLPESASYVNFMLYRENEDFIYNSFYVDRTVNFVYLNSYPGKYKLKCVIPHGRTNTGSLGDISGYEYYGKTLEWKIEIQRNPAPNLNLRYERVNENTFKLIWEQPDPEYGELNYYEISYWYDYWLAVTNETFYLVTLDPGSSEEYCVKAYFKGYYLSPLESYVYIYNY
jgi:hypothetical protein